MINWQDCYQQGSDGYASHLFIFPKTDIRDLFSDETLRYIHLSTYLKFSELKTIGKYIKTHTCTRMHTHTHYICDACKKYRRSKAFVRIHQKQLLADSTFPNYVQILMTSFPSSLCK